ncbi:helicase-related protein [Rubrimonas cliftonensis]|uniref:ATP-dependent RNA helicase SUPV3L1/SUV3 n=1 Tax=Rubrimonas cliftonensis TaxID=89524 RepID=A0A1H4FA38_9RHOB|nr:helicase-related protein [Rubrimonas cliftonensis]SEA94174.1 ATP-dependent RNA helicase SUPV3L1/SUV3 [Rubrimonas cliftonensis]
MTLHTDLSDARAAARDATVTAVLGPTNTGKTHYAIERMLAHRSGVFGFPLRLLAREVYDRVVALRGPRCAALITGEEKIAPPDAQYVLCTVEAMPLDWGAEFVAVDEIQLCADLDRGHVFTDRLLRARGSHETLFLGSDTMRGRIQALIPKARFVSRPRFSTLSYAGSKKVSRLPPRSAVVGFSVENVYAIAELLRRQKGGAAVVMGALSPRTRNAQVALYQNGDVEHLVATDAIGMGLNLDLRHVAFAGVSKFDGRRHRRLEPHELGQIAGRAGRHVTDGAFGVTGEARPLDEDVVERIVEHRYDPAPKLQWRSSRLEFGTVEALLRSLEAPPKHADLIRAREADDVASLRLLHGDEDVRDAARGGPQVRLLWDVCQTPDFRKTSPTEHVALLSRIYRFLLSDAGAIPCDWIEAQVARLDRTDGDIDALSKRLAHVRTWTYVANRGKWLDDPAGWRERTRGLEDRLSDALHERLTQRFVDRRTSVLMRRLKQKERLVAEVGDTGEVTVEGIHVGRLEGFRFRPDEEGGAEGLKTLKSASLQALQSHFSHRADRFYNAPDTEIDVTDQGGLMWGTDAVGRLEPGADQLSPQVRAFVDDSCDPAIGEKVARRLGHWVERRVKALFEPLLGLRDDPAMTGLARGVGFQLVEGLGVLQRRAVAEDVKALDQEGRALLRKHGVRFGQHHVFMPALLKPAPTRFRLLLWALHAKMDDFPSAPPPGLVTIPAQPGAPEGFYVRAGYRLAGPRALRIDMLERLADMVRQKDVRAGFEATPEMLSITGCTLEQFAELMGGLGYAAERGERPKATRVAAAAAEKPSPEAVAPEQAGPAEAAAEADAPAPVGALDGAPEAASGESAPAEAAPTIAEPVATPEAAASEATAPEAAASEAAAPEAAASEAAASDAGGEAPPEAGDAAPEPAAPVETGADDAAATTTREEEAAVGEQAAPAELEVFYTFTLAPRRGPRDRPAGQGRRDRGGDGAEGRGPRRGGQRRGAPGQNDQGAPDAGRAEAAPTSTAAPGGAPGGAPVAAAGAAAGDAPRLDAGHGGASPSGDARPPRDGPPRDGQRHGGKPEGGKGFGGGKQRGGKPGFDGKGGGKGAPKPRRDEGPRVLSAGPDKDRRTADADSPFAILKQLRDKL